jgi:hypothetical protein
MKPRHTKRPTFVLRLQPLPGIDGIRSLRLALKSLLRRFGLKALDVREEPPQRGKAGGR